MLYISVINMYFITVYSGDISNVILVAMNHLLHFYSLIVQILYHKPFHIEGKMLTKI